MPSESQVINNPLTRSMAFGLRGMAAGIIATCKPNLEIRHENDETYLRRWWLIKDGEASMNIYLHRMLLSDDERALHDHPWPSISFMLSGWLTEIYQDPHGTEKERVIEPGALVIRGAEFAHRLVIPPGKPVETLFITAPKIREWGFLCPQGWISHKRFTDPNDPGRIGAGCSG